MMRLYLAIIILMVALANGLAKPNLVTGTGDDRFIKVMNDSAKMVIASPGRTPNICQLYENQWDGLKEGTRWNGWWIQNSLGPSYCLLPFADNETFRRLFNSQALWFAKMGNGHRKDENGSIGPVGCLCDAASSKWIYYKQGDSKAAKCDWPFSFTAAGVLIECETLLISRDRHKLARYVPKLELAANFVLKRFDRKKKLFLVGPASNLLAPSYGGDNGKPSYLAELSVLMVRSMDRLSEVESLAGRPSQAAKYRRWQSRIKAGLPALIANGYFIMSLDRDGTRHGVYGARQHGYFEAGVNHDAIAFGVADDRQSIGIMKKMISIPGLRPHTFVIANYPAYDDLLPPSTTELWKYGRWVNGGAWSGNEARMILAYFRTGRYADAEKSAEKIQSYAKKGWLDNPFSDFGTVPYHGPECKEVTYDIFGPPAAMLRGALCPEYRAQTLGLTPALPAQIRRISFPPLRWGKKKIFVEIQGRGRIKTVQMGKLRWNAFTGSTVTLSYQKIPRKCRLKIIRE